MDITAYFICQAFFCAFFVPCVLCSFVPISVDQGGNVKAGCLEEILMQGHHTFAIGIQQPHRLIARFTPTNTDSVNGNHGDNLDGGTRQENLLDTIDFFEANVNLLVLDLIGTLISS